VQQFSLKRLFGSVLLIATGFGAVAHAIELGNGALPVDSISPFWFAGVILIGAGLLHLLNRIALGACLGLAMQFFVLIWIRSH